MTIRRLLMAIGLLTFVVVPVGAAFFPNFPFVGGASYCASYTGAAGTTCAVTVPAGPTIVPTGTRLLGDTYIANGAPPQTVSLGLHSLNSMPWTFTTASSAANNTVTTTTTQGGILLVGTGALSPVTLTLPPTPIDGQTFGLSSNQTAASLTIAGAGGATVANNPTALTVSTTGPYGYQFKYRASTTTWYRMQ